MSRPHSRKERYTRSSSSGAPPAAEFPWGLFKGRYLIGVFTSRVQARLELSKRVGPSFTVRRRGRRKVGKSG